MRKVKVELLVSQASEKDVYKDIARIHESKRGGVREGSICKLKVNGRCRSFVVRGLEDVDRDCIRLDELGRKALGLEQEQGSNQLFEICPVSPLGMAVWACSVAEPGARIAAWLAVWSLVLALGGAGLAILPLLKPR